MYGIVKSASFMGESAPPCIVRVKSQLQAYPQFTGQVSAFTR